MDWFVEAGDDSALTELRRRIGEYLRRHCTADSDVAGAELAVSEILSNVVRHAHSPAWVSLEWSHEEPVLTVSDLGPGFDLGNVLPGADDVGGRGLFIVSKVVHEG